MKMNILNSKQTTKSSKWGGTFNQLILTIDMEGDDKFEILTMFNKDDTARENVSLYKIALKALADERFPTARGWTMCRPANGGYQYMKFFPKNNPTKFTLVFRS